MTGRAQEAREFFAASFARGDYETDAALESWARTVDAETAVALDLPSEADAEFRAALATARRDGGRPAIYLVAAHADFLLDSGRYTDALALLRDAPLNDATLLRAATAKKRLGLAVDEEIRILSHHLELTLSEHEQTHGREAAYFLRHVLDEPADALAFAVRNFAEQRELLDARLVLESALAVCDAAAAAPVLDWMRANAVEHAMLARLRDSLEECP
jgi:hypothetical protein